jgi:hypothetical protein
MKGREEGRANRRKATIKMGGANIAIYSRKGSKASWLTGDDVTIDARVWESLATPVDGDVGIEPEGECEGIIVVIRRGESPTAKATASELRAAIQRVVLDLQGQGTGEVG